MSKKEENALVKLDASKLPAHLRGAEDVADEFLGGISEGMPLPMLSLRGRQFRGRKGGQEVPLHTPDGALEVVIIAARPTVSRRYYDKGYEIGGSPEAPRCASIDGLKPNTPDPISSACSSCEYGAWGSKVTPSGKRAKICSDYKRVIVWMIGAPLPFVLDIPAASLKTPKNLRGDGVMMFADYVSNLRVQKVQPQIVVTSLHFTDSEFPQLHMRYVRLLTAEEYAKVQELRKMDEVQQVLQNEVSSGDVDTENVEEKEKVQEAPPPAEKKKTTRKAKKKEPEPEPEPEPESEFSVGDQVSWQYRGSELTGEIVSLSEDEDSALVKRDDNLKNTKVYFADMSLAEGSDEDENEEEPSGGTTQDDVLADVRALLNG